MKFELDIDLETFTSLKDVLVILDRLEWLQSVTSDPGLLQDLKDTFSHYEGIKDDMLIEISNELGLQFEEEVKNRCSL